MDIHGLQLSALHTEAGVTAGVLLWAQARVSLARSVLAPLKQRAAGIHAGPGLGAWLGRREPGAWTA